MPDILHIRRAAAVIDDEAATVAKIEAHRDALPRAQGRRMSPLGLALDLAMADDAPEETDALVYVSRYAMSRSLEDYLASFPHPSPLAFQNAIHPAGVEQFLVPRKRSVRELTPLAADTDSGIAPALRALFLSPGITRRLVGGEERGARLASLGAASDRTFAFALTVATTPSPDDLGAVTRETFSGDIAPLAPEDFAKALATKTPARAAAPGFGVFTLSWL